MDSGCPPGVLGIRTSGGFSLNPGFHPYTDLPSKIEQTFHQNSRRIAAPFKFDVYLASFPRKSRSGYTDHESEVHQHPSAAVLDRNKSLGLIKPVGNPIPAFGQVDDGFTA